MRNWRDILGGIFYFSSLGAGGLIGLVFGFLEMGWVLTLLWNWFFASAQLSIWQAIVLILLCQVLPAGTKVAVKMKVSNAKEAWIAFAFGFLYPLLILGLGWFIHILRG